MSYPLKNNLINKRNVNLTMLDDTTLDDRFGKSLETLINGWSQNSINNITLSNTSNKDKFAVQFTATTNNNSNEYSLRDYTNEKINPTLSDGQLNVNISNKQITFTQKNTTQKNTETDKTKPTNTTTSSSTNLNTSDSISSIAQQLVQGGVFDNPMIKDVAIQEHNNIFEEIQRVKKLMKL